MTDGEATHMPDNPTRASTHLTHTPLTLPLHASHTVARQRTLRSRVSQAEKLAADRVSIEPVQEKQLLGSFFSVRVFTFQRALTFKGFSAPINTFFIHSDLEKKGILDKDESRVDLFLPSFHHLSQLHPHGFASSSCLQQGQDFGEALVPHLLQVTQQTSLKKHLCDGSRAQEA